MKLANATRFLAILAFFLAILAFAAGVATAQDKSNGGLDQYRLGAGDQIKVSVFQNPDLTVETRVGEDGYISYPLVGRVRVGGLTVAAAERALAQALEKGKFLQHPQVNVAPLQMRSMQVSVLGEVRDPGRFALQTVNTRVSEMLAMAGGIGPTGADVAILTGQRGGKPFRKEIDIPALFLSKGMDEDIPVRAGDVIYVQRAQVFYIYGEVNNPGSFKIQREMTVRQALAQGGGLTPRGTERRLELHRRDAEGKLRVHKPKLDDPVQPNDVLQVREALF
jgi:polysaccharide export outer membrane protein